MTFERCATCNQIQPSAAWSSVAFELAMPEFRYEWLDGWSKENQGLLVEALDENVAHDAEDWERVLSPPQEPLPFALRIIGERHPEVEWLSGCPAEERRWWRRLPQARDWLTRSFPQVTEEEWAAILS